MSRADKSRFGVAAAMVATVFIVLPPTAWASHTSRPASHSAPSHAVRSAPHHAASPAIHRSPHQNPVIHSPLKLSIPTAKSPATHHRILDAGISPKLHVPVLIPIPIAIVPKLGPVTSRSPLNHQKPVKHVVPTVRRAPPPPHNPATLAAQKNSNGAPTTKLAARFRDENMPMAPVPPNTPTPPSTALTPQETNLAIDILSVLSQLSPPAAPPAPVVPKLRGVRFLPPEILAEPGAQLGDAPATNPPSGLTYVMLPKTSTDLDPPAIPATPASPAPPAPPPPQPSANYYSTGDMAEVSALGILAGLLLSML